MRSGDGTRAETTPDGVGSKVGTDVPLASSVDLPRPPEKDPPRPPETAWLAYRIVDHEDAANAEVPTMAEQDLAAYFEDVTHGRSGDQTEPWLVITYGPAGAGKSWLVRNFLSQQGLGEEGSYVVLDPDSLRFYSKEYRCCLSGAHAAKLPSVRQKYGDRLMSIPWRAPIGGFCEDGIAVAGETGEPEFCLALATAATRSTPIVRGTEDGGADGLPWGMLWGRSRKLDDGSRVPPDINDCFVDRAFKAGFNIVYNSPRRAPDKFMRELMRRARSLRPYRVIVLGVYCPTDTAMKRCEHREMEEGRHTPAAFFDAVYNEIFPPDDTAHTVHYDKFRKELRQGDEIWLFDNSGDAVRDNDRSLPPILKHERVDAQ